jgi:hypothetical protein
MFYPEPDAKGLRKEEFVKAMRRLFATHKIHVAQYGRPSRPNSRLEIGTAPSL